MSESKFVITNYIYSNICHGTSLKKPSGNVGTNGTVGTNGRMGKDSVA